MSYEIHYSDGREETHDSYAEAVAAVAEQYEECVIGHDGDLSSGGDRTLCWASEADSIDDDGARAVASIRRGERALACCHYDPGAVEARRDR